MYFILCILRTNIFNKFVTNTKATKKGAVKKSATKPVDFLDMEAHGL